jgi:hypothetical protein
MAKVMWKLQRTREGAFRALCCVPISAKNATRSKAASLGFGWGDLARAATKATSKVSKVAVKAASSTPAGALLKATATIAELAQNPVLQAVLPPGTGAALKATLLVTRAVQAGKGKAALARLKGPGAKRLASALIKMQPPRPTAPPTEAPPAAEEKEATAPIDAAEAAELLE